VPPADFGRLLPPPSAEVFMLDWISALTGPRPPPRPAAPLQPLDDHLVAKRDALRYRRNRRRRLAELDPPLLALLSAPTT